jgi:hypothetical protein
VDKILLTRGAVNGPWQRAGFLPPGRAHVWRLEVQGPELFRVRALGGAEADLELTVRNGRGVLLGANAGPNPGVDWSPPGSGEIVTVRLANRGAAGTPYRLLGN